MFGAPRPRLLESILGNPANLCYGAFDMGGLVGLWRLKCLRNAAKSVL
jgi:hypothetical protein